MIENISVVAPPISTITIYSLVSLAYSFKIFSTPTGVGIISIDVQFFNSEYPSQTEHQRRPRCTRGNAVGVGSLGTGHHLADPTFLKPDPLRASSQQIRPYVDSFLRRLTWGSIGAVRSAQASTRAAVSWLPDIVPKTRCAARTTGRARRQTSRQAG